MALNTSSLAAALSATDTTLSITSATGLPAVGVSASSQLLLVDGEFMETIDGISQPVALTIKVRSRGCEGTSAVAHDILAPTTTSGTKSDFPILGKGANCPRPPYVDAMTSIGQNGVITVPVQNTTCLITKATALSSTTLAAPSKASNGVRLTITSITDAAHVITATALINDGASGAPEDTITFAAFAGASITLVACNGLWNMTAQTAATIT